MVLLQVPGDGVSAGIETLLRELFAQQHDLLNGLGGDRVRGAVGSSGAWFKRGVAVNAPSGDEFGDPSFRDAVGAGGLGFAEALDGDGGDDQARFRHVVERAGKFPMS